MIIRQMWILSQKEKYRAEARCRVNIIYNIPDSRYTQTDPGIFPTDCILLVSSSFLAQQWAGNQALQPTSLFTAAGRVCHIHTG